MSAERINGGWWERVGGLTIPTPVPGAKPTDPIPETRVKMTFEIEGGGIEEGEKVTVEFEPVTLTRYGQLEIDLLELEPDDTVEYDPVSIRVQPKMLRLKLDPTRVPESGTIYRVTFPGGSRSQ